LLFVWAKTIGNIMDTDNTSADNIAQYIPAGNVKCDFTNLLLSPRRNMYVRS